MRTKESIVEDEHRQEGLQTASESHSSILNLECSAANLLTRRALKNSRHQKVLPFIHTSKSTAFVETPETRRKHCRQVQWTAGEGGGRAARKEASRQAVQAPRAGQQAEGREIRQIHRTYTWHRSFELAEILSQNIRSMFCECPPYHYTRCVQAGKCLACTNLNVFYTANRYKTQSRRTREAMQTQVRHRHHHHQQQQILLLYTSYTDKAKQYHKPTAK